ncbi:MAG: hypothetical protein HC812_03155 [Leptolyngbya sp. RL_3_1]|nr:hypothetical protein [Leptolyngbya sp. RL_3_1]
MVGVTFFDLQRGDRRQIPHCKGHGFSVSPKGHQRYLLSLKGLKHLIDTPFQGFH